MLERVLTFIIPDWSVTYLEYGDDSNLTLEEIDQLERFKATELPADGNYTLEWGEDAGFVQDHDLGGLAANCIELHLCVDVPRRATDPTRAEMRRALVKAFRAPQWERGGWDRVAWKFDVEAAIYWFSNEWNGGQWSNLYAALSTSLYRPGPLCRGPERYTAQVNMYHHLVETFCPRTGNE
ncbi:MAG: hypothetical protein EBR82_70040 [Caulobacteraceae bacterium]|nr:hypothetical protein [Caulobacteraceae bacterium]